VFFSQGLELEAVDAPPCQGRWPRSRPGPGRCAESAVDVSTPSETRNLKPCAVRLVALIGGKPCWDGSISRVPVARPAARCATPAARAVLPVRVAYFDHISTCRRFLPLDLVLDD